MLKKKNMKTLHGQSVLEYVLLVGIITIALFAMMQAMKRGTQSLIRTAADELGVQNTADQFRQVANSSYQAIDDRRGYLEYSNTASSSNVQKSVVERVGVTNYILDEQQEQTTISKTNMGLTAQ